MKDDSPGMELDLGRIENRETFSFEEIFEIPTLEGGDAECDARVAITVVRTGNRYDCDAKVAGKIQANCHRCLERFGLQVESAFTLAIERAETAKLPEGLEEEDFVIIPVIGEDRYDIFPRVREALLLELPIKLLCREDCKGLCPRCGANLNRDACACGSGEVDSRWGPLRKLLNGEDKS
jgi:DUF177 domain-containing protein